MFDLKKILVEAPSKAFQKNYYRCKSLLRQSSSISQEKRTRKSEYDGALNDAERTIANRYFIWDKLGSGANGVVFSAVDLKNNKPLAVKFASGAKGYAMLQKENEIHSILNRKAGDVNGLTSVHYFGKKNNRHALVMDRHGPSLEQIIKKTNGKLSTRGMLTIGIQALQRIEYIHSKGYIHRDVKPENMVIGLDKTDTLYFIDFGLANKYYDFTEKRHIPQRKTYCFAGTLLFSSHNADKFLEQSRRDDLESIGLVMIYLLKGSLPWSNIEHKPGYDYFQQVCDAKRKTSLEVLCAGAPEEVLQYLKYVRRLRFEERPDYYMLINLLLRALENTKREKATE